MTKQTSMTETIKCCCNIEYIEMTLLSMFFNDVFISLNVWTRCVVKHDELMDALKMNYKYK